ncbi:hypothetical protein ES703_106992 [subsurface metagenome]
MASLEQLSVLAKSVMGAVVDAEMLGLNVVRGYLGMAFDEIARQAADVRETVARVEAERLLEESGEVVDES